MPTPSNSTRDFIPPATFAKGGTVFEYLMACRPQHGTQPLELRIIRSTFRTAKVPKELEEDAAQEIRLAWATIEAKADEFEPEQVLQYAYDIAKQAALRLRRAIQNTSSLPGNAFRKRADGSRYAPDAVLTPALSWEDMDHYHRTDSGEDEDAVIAPASPNGGPELSTDQDVLLIDLVEPGPTATRAQFFEQCASRLSSIQFEILQDMASGLELKEIHDRRHISYIRLIKEIAICSSILGVDISKIDIGPK